MKRNVILSMTAAFIIAAAFSSCSVVKTTTSKSFDIYGAGVVQTPVLVDLDVEETKVTGTASGSTSESFESIKQKAVANAIEVANADVLVEPTFKTTTSNGTVFAEVVGFPATYKNFRTIQEKDIDLLEAGIVQKAEVYEPKSDNKKPNKKGVIWGTIGGAAVLILLLLVTG